MIYSILAFIWVGSSIFCLFVCETDEAKSSRRFHWGQSGQIPQEENVWRWSQEQGGLWNWDPPPWKQFFPAPCSEKNPKKTRFPHTLVWFSLFFFFFYTIVLFNFFPQTWHYRCRWPGLLLVRYNAALICITLLPWQPRRGRVCGTRGVLPSCVRVSKSI